MKKNKLIKTLLTTIAILALTLTPHYANASTKGIIIDEIPFCGAYRYYIKFKNIPEEEFKNIKVTIADNTIADVELNQILKTIEINEKKIGKTTLTAKLTYKGKTYTDSYEIRIVDPAGHYHLLLTGINNIKVGEKTQLTLEMAYCSLAYMIVSSSPDLTWTSSNTNIATVNSDGQVTGISAGTTTITATYKIDTKSDLNNIIFKKADHTITVNPTENKQNTNTNNFTNNTQNIHQEEPSIETNTTNENSENSTSEVITNNEKFQDNPTTLERIKGYLKEYEFLIKIIGILLLICLILKIIQANIKPTK